MNVQQTQRSFTVAINDKYEVLYVGWGAPPPGHLEEEIFTVITGDLAELLFTSLAGRRFDEEPITASPANAGYARAHLSWMGNADLPRKVIERWGGSIKPWLGYVSLKPNGNPEVKLPIYERAIDLGLTETA